jgi:hypothetical protein
MSSFVPSFTNESFAILHTSNSVINIYLSSASIVFEISIFIFFLLPVFQQAFSLSLFHAQADSP